MDPQVQEFINIPSEGKKVICVNQKKELWYIYQNHSWKKFNYVHNKPDSFYETSQYITQLDSEGKELYNIMYDPNFEKHLDNNISLLGFENGVYDFNINKFRNGKPSDLISLSFDRLYDTSNLNYSNCVITEIILREHFTTDVDVFTYFMKFLAMCVAGKSVDYVHIFESCHNEELYAFILSLLHPYSKKISSDTFEHCKGVRLLYIDQCTSSYIKNTLATDRIYINKNDEETVSYTSSWNIITKKLVDPKLDDGGLWRRVRHIPLPLFDKTNIKKMMDMKNYILCLLINKYYPMYLKESLIAPDNIVKSILKYKESFFPKKYTLLTFNNKKNIFPTNNITSVILYNIPNITFVDSKYDIKEHDDGIFCVKEDTKYDIYEKTSEEVISWTFSTYNTSSIEKVGECELISYTPI